MPLLERFPWVNVLAVLAAIGGAVIVVIQPTTLDYNSYLTNLSYLLGGAGVLTFARVLSGKEASGALAVIDRIPWASVIGFVAAVSGLVVVIVHPETLTYPEWLQDVGKLLIGAGVFGAARAHAGMATNGAGPPLT